jgi:recombination protein RecA
MGRPRKNSNAAIEEAANAVKSAVDNQLLSETEGFTKVPRRAENLYRTYVPELDYILKGGLPRGQMVHLYGPEGSGKSTLAVQIALAVQKQGGKVAYFDPENSLDADYVTTLGMKIEQPDLYYQREFTSGEKTLDVIEKLVRANAVDLVVLDSVVALPSVKEIESSNEEDNVAIQARMFSKAVKKLNIAAVNSNTVILLVNQLRSNIQMGYGVKPFTTPCGKAIQFFSNINIYIQRIGSIKKAEQVIGQEVRIRTEKTKHCAPFKDAVTNLIYGEGFSRARDLFKIGKDRGILSGTTWVSYKDNKWNGLEDFLKSVEANTELLDILQEDIYGKSLSTNGVAGAGEPSAGSQTDEPPTS